MKAFLTCFFLFCFISISAQERILVDGIFSDWEDKPILYNDNAGDGGNSDIDFEIFKVSQDENYFFFYVELNTEINLQTDEDVTLYIDADDDNSTGLSIYGIGAELSYNFGARGGWYYGTGSSLPISQNDIGLASAPTVTSDIFELFIKRDLVLFGNTVFEGNTLSFAMENGESGDSMPSTEGSITYDVIDFALGDLPSYSIGKPETSDLRIMNYNVLFDGFFDSDNYNQHARILNAIQPDIIGFQEIYSHDSQEVQTNVISMLGSTTGVNWFNAQAGSSDNHVVSKYPILENYTIQGSGSGASAVNGAFLIDVPSLDEHMLFIVAHTPCCANNEDRQLEIDAIMSFVRNAKEGIGPLDLDDNSPIVIVGDMNLVGFNQQLTTFLTGDIVNDGIYGPDFSPDWNGEDFKDARPYTTNVPGNFSWYAEGSSFSPGRLDFNIYSGSVLNLENAYSLFTPAMPLDSLDANGLLLNDVTSVSDHLPMVCDFSYLLPSSIDEIGKLLQFNIYPNPTTEASFIEISIENPTQIEVEIHDIMGRKMKQKSTHNVSSDNNLIKLDLKNLDSGEYIVNLTVDGKVYYKTISKL